ncbi:hypothetical protein HOD75_04525 [archaeon]|jgi:hypothetical protein|nr:hypothetical protein [archaeon]MBT4242130.1 hypothetical protein [archaeon]MBT4417818.1 hypothetical protein [archaeon]
MTPRNPNQIEQVIIVTPYEGERKVIRYDNTCDGRFGFIEKMDGNRRDHIREWDFHISEADIEGERVKLKPFGHTRIFREKTKGYQERMEFLNSRLGVTA